VIPGEVVIVNRFGAYPLQITRPQGPFSLLIENRRPNKEETFMVGPKGSPSVPPVLTLHTHDHVARANGVLDLSPGTYELRLQGDGNTVIEITITN
jgi:hypothetical protein